MPVVKKLFEVLCFLPWPTPTSLTQSHFTDRKADMQSDYITCENYMGNKRQSQEQNSGQLSLVLSGLFSLALEFLKLDLHKIYDIGQVRQKDVVLSKVKEDYFRTV